MYILLYRAVHCVMCPLGVQVKFVKSGSVAIVQIAVEKAICVEKFDDVPQVG
jgi:translation elongation factor EF-1alpha